MYPPIFSALSFLQQLRQQLITKRGSIPARQREQYARQAWTHLRHWRRLNQFQSIACYLPVGAEFPTHYLIQGLQQLHKEIFLPIVQNNNKIRHLTFQHYHPQTPMRRNRFGITEPIPNPREQIPPPQLDLVIMPLTGFDNNGNRIGMGGGFYDRTFEFLLKRKQTPQPFMLGLGFQIQECETIDSRHWDIPLDGVLTEEKINLIGM